ncbi:MAG: hypothetical protein Ta2B_09230 [Termitinemataceae bacterium]|nr:MAG: hypothetical protein Ta2B_09230 [Termitinemataceae bacterium]
MAVGSGKKEKGLPAQTELARINENSRIVGQMLNAFIRGKATGDKEVRAVRLVENLWELAMNCETPAVKLAATKEILDRVDGKVVEHKEVKSMRIEGIVFIPPSEKIEAEAIKCG